MLEFPVFFLCEPLSFEQHTFLAVFKRSLHLVMSLVILYTEGLIRKAYIYYHIHTDTDTVKSALVKLGR